MRKKGNVSLSMVLVAFCAALIFFNAGGRASGVQTAEGVFTGCGMYRALHEIHEAWQEGFITHRDLAVAKAKAFYEERSGGDPTCSEEVLEDLKNEVLEDVYRLSDELLESDKLYLASMNADLAEALDRETGGREPDVLEQEHSHKVSVQAPSAFARVAKALSEGTIGLKESVLLRAQLLYAPQSIPPESEFAFRHGEKAGEECGTGFYKDVHRIRDLVDEDEKAFLRSLSPSLDAIMRSWEGAAQALPNYPELDQKVEGRMCTVHYTLTGADAVKSAKDAAKVAAYIDLANMVETRPGHFREAKAEGGGKMQVYCLGEAKMGRGVLGAWDPVSNVSGSAIQRSGYIMVNSGLTGSRMKAVAFHEYFHGCQSAYNDFSDLWFQEGSAKWAEAYYGNYFLDLVYSYDDAESIFKMPNQVLWYEGDQMRKYSTSALVYFFSDRYGGYEFVRSYFLNSEIENDAVLNLSDALNSHGTDFGSQYKQFLISMYRKQISSVKKYMPNVKLASTVSDYGLSFDGEVYLTGANFYKLEAPSDKKLRKAALITWSEPTGGGKPEAVLAAKNPGAKTDVQNGRAYIYRAQEAVLITTDTMYTGTGDTAQRPYKATVVTPYIEIHKVTPETPIHEGEISDIDISYDLLGTVTGKPFQATVAITEKTPSVEDRVSGDTYMATGTDQDLWPYLGGTQGAPGTYKLTFQISVPPDSWNIPQVSSKGKCTIIVLPGAAGETGSRKAGTPGPTLEIAH